MQHDSTPTTVELKSGLNVTIDAGDVPRVSALNWNISRAKDRPDYVVTSTWDPSTKTANTLYLHRFIIIAKKGQIVDHIDGDTMNNTRSNLRIATHQQNMANSKKRIGNTGYKGVQKRCDGKKWVARIQVNRKGIHLGSFTTPEDAARAYDDAAVIHFGEFARLNFPN